MLGTLKFLVNNHTQPSHLQSPFSGTSWAISFATVPVYFTSHLQLECIAMQVLGNLCVMCQLLHATVQCSFSFHQDWLPSCMVNLDQVDGMLWPLWRYQTGDISRHLASFWLKLCQGCPVFHFWVLQVPSYWSDKGNVVAVAAAMGFSGLLTLLCIWNSPMLLHIRHMRIISCQHLKLQHCCAHLILYIDDSASSSASCWWSSLWTHPPSSELPDPFQAFGPSGPERGN